MIKVLNVIEEGRGGGPLFQTARMAKQLKGTIDMKVIAPAIASAFHQDLEQSGIKSFPTDIHPLTKDPNGLRKYIFNFRKEVRMLSEIFKREQADLIHVNGAYQIKGLLAAKKANIPVLWYMNDAYQPVSIRRLFKRYAKRADYFVFASRRSETYYSNIAPEIRRLKQVIIPAPVDTNQYKPKSHAGVSRSKPFDIATVGYVNIHKGISYLLEAARELEELPIRFHLVGPVLESQEKFVADLRRLSKRLSNFYWHDYKKDTSLWLRDMDLYVCSSIRESSPMAVWEAMATGMPVVSTDVGDVRDILDRYQCGVTVPVEDGIALANAIREIHNLSAQQRVEMGQRSRIAMMENMSLEKTGEQYYKFVNSIISG